MALAFMFLHHRKRMFINLAFVGADHRTEQLAQIAIEAGTVFILETGHQQRRVQARVGVPAKACRTAHVLGQRLSGALFGTEFYQQRCLLFSGQRQRHTSARAHGHGLPDRFEIEVRLILQFIHGQEAVPAFIVHVETQAGEVGNEALITHGQHTGVDRQALFHLRRTEWQAEGFREQFFAVEQRRDGLG
ncbi:hypothetical protein D3C84_776530 [compost metagenome]